MERAALATYLADHLAGAAYAIELIRSCRKEYADPPLGPFFERLGEEVEEDREVLRAFARRIGASESRVKGAAAWTAEKLSRVKHGLGDRGDGAGTGLLERLETLAIGVRGKRMLWQALDAASGGTGTFGGVALDGLVRRAKDQLDEIERHRLSAARDALGRRPVRPGDARSGSDHPLRGVLLDLDGTLVDTNDAHARAWAEALAEAGHPVSFERVRPLIGMGGDELVRRLTDVDPEGETSGRIRRRHREIFLERHLAGCGPFPSVRPLLERMRAEGLELVVATSAEPDVERRVTEAAGIADLVEGATSAGDVDRAKPEPDLVEAAVRLGGWSPEEVLMLGDTPYDVAAGNAAGVGVVAFRCGGSGDAELAGALAVYADPAELLARFDASPFARVASGARG